MRVLVVDDSGVIRGLIVRILRLMGVRQIVQASDGVEAWDAFNAKPVDLVITDWDLPRVSGIELTRNIRGINRDVPIVMVSIFHDKPRIVEALQAGVSDYCCMPFERDVFQAKLDRFIPPPE